MSVIYRPKRIELTPKQSLAHRVLWKQSTVALACVTGYGGGKSFLNALTLNYVAEKYPGIYMMAGSPTYPMLKRTLWRSMKEVTPPGNIVRVNNQELSMVLDYHNGNAPFSEVFFLPASVPAQNWQGANLGFALLDESDGIPEAHYVQTWARLRMEDKYHKLEDCYHVEDGKGFMPNKMLIATNPPPNDHWLPRDFYYHPKLGHRLLQWSTMKNPHIPERTVRNLLDTYKGEEAQAAVYGKIGIRFKGQFFDNFDPAKHVITEERAKKIRATTKHRIYGIDYGYVDPFVFVELCYWEKKNAWVVTNIFYMSRTVAKERAHEIFKWWDKIDPIYDDHQRAERAELEEHGIYTTPAQKVPFKGALGKSGVVTSLLFMRRMLNKREDGNFSLYIGAHCEPLIHEFGSFRRIEIPDKVNQFYEDKFEGLDHAIDATRYALYTHLAGPSSFLGAGNKVRDGIGFTEDSLPDPDDPLEQERSVLRQASPREINDYGARKSDDGFYFGH